MVNGLTIRFLEEKEPDEVSIRSVRGFVGLYFIFLADIQIPYPLRSSRLIYIGMSESRQNSISNRLRDHKSGQSGNPGLTNYIANKPVRFTHHTTEFLKVLGTTNVAELEGVFIRDFLSHHGAYPICNNQARVEPEIETPSISFVIDWKYFD